MSGDTRGTALADPRARFVDKLKARMLRRGLPRLEMSAMVLGAGFAGFLASVLLLRAGVSSMWQRYPLAVLVAYLAFLVILRVWVRRHHRKQSSGIDAVDLLELPLPSRPRSGPRVEAPEPMGHGGGFGGGGAGRSWGSPAPRSSSSTSELGGSSPAPSGRSILDGIDLPLDLDDAGIFLVPLVFALAGIVALIWVVYAAPVLLAEIALDVALASGLYRRLNRIEPRYWLATAVKRTWLPVLGVALLLAATGLVFESIAPKADSIGDVLRKLLA